MDASPEELVKVVQQHRWQNFPVVNEAPSTWPWVLSFRSHTKRVGPVSWPLPGTGCFVKGLLGQTLVLLLPVSTLASQKMPFGNIAGKLDEDRVVCGVSVEVGRCEPPGPTPGRVR